MHPDTYVDPPPSKTNWLAIFVLIVVGVALAATLLRVPREQQRAGDGTRHAAVGKTLETLAVEPLVNTKTKVSVGDVRGKITLVNFWGPWCPPCMMEFPELVALEKKYRDRDNARILLVAYGRGDTKEELEVDVLRALQRHKSDAPIYFDPTDRMIGAVTSTAQLDGFGFPTTLILDQRGVIRGLWMGYDARYVSEMEELLESLTAERMPKEAEKGK